MDEQYIREHDVVDRYLRNELTEEEQDAFELYYFEHPRIRRELELEKAMRDALRAAMGPDSPGAGPAREPWSQRLMRMIASPAWSLTTTAATAALLVAFAAGWYRAPAPAIVPVVADVQLVRMRGPGDDVAPLVTIADEGIVTLTVDVAGLDPGSLRGTLSGPDGGAIAVPLNDQAGNGEATVSIRSQVLHSGLYNVKVTDRSGSRITYAFEVERRQ
jgi:anti-sigma factor RsiW